MNGNDVNIRKLCNTLERMHDECKRTKDCSKCLMDGIKCDAFGDIPERWDISEVLEDILEAYVRIEFTDVKNGKLVSD